VLTTHIAVLHTALPVTDSRPAQLLHAQQCTAPPAAALPDSVGSAAQPGHLCH